MRAIMETGMGACQDRPDLGCRHCAEYPLRASAFVKSGFAGSSKSRVRLRAKTTGSESGASCRPAPEVCSAPAADRFDLPGQITRLQFQVSFVAGGLLRPQPKIYGLRP